MRRWVSGCAALVVLLGTSLPAYAVDVNGCPIVPNAQCPAANLDNAVLPNSDLHDANLELATAKGADLHDSNLTFANLQRTEFDSANLSSAVLSGATLTGASFVSANLSEANLNSAITPFGSPMTITVPGSGEQQLATVNFTGANLTSAVARGADLGMASFHSATLWGASFKGSDMRATDLRNAMAYQSDFRHVNLKGADLKDADFSGADMRWVTFDPYQLSHLNFICDKKTLFNGAHKKKLDKYCRGNHDDCPIILFPCSTAERPCGSVPADKYGRWTMAYAQAVIARCYPEYAGRPWSF